MKIRTFQKLENYRFVVRVVTEDWSEGDISLMRQYGEPEIDVGGTVAYVYGGSSSDSDSSSGIANIRYEYFATNYIKIMTRFPYMRIFDGRDYESVDEAIAVGKAWSDDIETKIRMAVRDLRAMTSDFQHETVEEV